MKREDTNNPSELNECLLEAASGGKETKMELEVGDNVLISKYSGTEVKVDGTKYNISG